MRLADKVAIIAGGAESIGQAYAIAFAKEGSKVVVAEININNAGKMKSPRGSSSAPNIPKTWLAPLCTSPPPTVTS